MFWWPFKPSFTTQRFQVSAWLAMIFCAWVVCAPSALAHEKWFHDGPMPQMCWCRLQQRRTLLTLGVVAALTLVAGLAWQLRRHRDFVPGPRQSGASDATRAKFYGVLPAMLAIHLAVPLLVLGLTGRLLAPNLQITGAWRLGLGFGQTLCALALFYGVLTRAASVLLALLWIATLALFGIEPACENLGYLAFAAFFFLTGRGPYAVDRLLFPRLEPTPRLMPYAMPVLRIGIGVTLGVLAFTEKLANPQLAMEFLRQHPVNFTAALHIPMCDATFILCAGAVELLAGLWIALGIFPRTIILIALIPFNMSLTIFNWTELVGHLPFYGALAALLVWTPSDEDRSLWSTGVSGKAGFTPAVAPVPNGA